MPAGLYPCAASNRPSVRPSRPAPRMVKVLAFMALPPGGDGDRHRVQSREERGEIDGQGSFDRQTMGRTRVREFQTQGMERQSIVGRHDRPDLSLERVGIPSAAVKTITDDGIPQARQMDPDLMRAARFGT